MDKKAIVAGETLRVTCPVGGYPIESIVWERDTRVLPINRKQKVFPNGTLIIENVERMSDQATYTCVARNAQGYSARGTLEVQVMGKFDTLLPYILSRLSRKFLSRFLFYSDHCKVRWRNVQSWNCWIVLNKIKLWCKVNLMMKFWRRPFAFSWKKSLFSVVNNNFTFLARVK